MCKSLKTDQFHFYVVKTSKENQQTPHGDTTVVAGFESAVDARRFALQSTDCNFFTSVCDSKGYEIWRFS